MAVPVATLLDYPKVIRTLLSHKPSLEDIRKDFEAKIQGEIGECKLLFK